MSKLLKPVVASFLALIMTTCLLTRANKVSATWTEQELHYALQVATQDATAMMMDESFLFGAANESSEFAIDLDRAAEQFQDSFYTNIGSTVSSIIVNKTSIALCGYIGYRCAYGMYANGVTTAAFSYSTSLNDRLYEFTLGDRIYVTDLSSAAESELALSTLPEHYFSPTLTNNQFRQVTVMTAINNYLSVFCADEQNISLVNSGAPLSFDLGTVDYATDDPSIITQLSAVIDGPGFFAVVDCWDTNTSDIIRIFSFGAAELLLTM